VWDIFLFEGYKIVYRTSLALLKTIEKTLLESSFEKVMEMLRDISKYADAEHVMEVSEYILTLMLSTLNDDDVVICTAGCVFYLVEAITYQTLSI
jgi:hypothetical protein